MKIINRSAAGAAVLSLLLLVSACGGEPAAEQPTPEQGQETTVEFSFPKEEGSADGLTNFKTLDIYGATVTPDVFAAADLTMVNIWGTFCSPCLDEMPYLAEIDADYADKGFQIVGLVVDVQKNDGTVNEDMAAKARSIAEDTGADYPHLIPSPLLYGGILKDVQYIPYTVFVDSSGKLVGEAYVGSRSKKEWIEIIEPML